MHTFNRGAKRARHYINLSNVVGLTLWLQLIIIFALQILMNVLLRLSKLAHTTVPTLKGLTAAPVAMVTSSPPTTAPVCTSGSVP